MTGITISYLLRDGRKDQVKNDQDLGGRREFTGEEFG